MENKKKVPVKINKMRVILFILIIFVLLVALIITINSVIKNKNVDPETKYVKVQEDGTKVNTSKKLAESKNIEGIEIKDISLKEKNDVTVLEATAVNTNNETKEEFMINIEFVNEDGQTITKIVGYISRLQPGESTTIKTQTTLDFSNAYNINITKI